MTAAVAVVAAVVTLVVPQVVAHAGTAGKGGDYVPFTTARLVLETRDGTGGVTGARGANTTTSFQALGVGGIPTSGVSGLVVRISAAAPTAAGYLTVFADGTTRPSVSMVTFSAGQTLSNFAVVAPAANGKLSVYNSLGNTHVRVEVQGYFTSTSTGSTGGEVPIPQVRAVDTTTGVGTTKAKILAGGTRTVTLTAGGVPAATASAIYATVTVPTTTAPGYVQATAVGVSTPGMPVLDYAKSINNTSGAMITLGTNGQVTFTNKGTVPVDLIVDTMAYFSKTSTAGAAFQPLTNRLFGASVPANSTVDVVVGGTSGMPTRGIAGAALSFEASGTAAATLRAWPVGMAEPAVALTQHAPNARHRSSGIVKPGLDGKIRIRNNSTSATFVYVDLEGWFADPLPAIPVTQYSPVIVKQSVAVAGQGAGTVEYSYVDNIGRVVIGHQTQLDNFANIQFTVISGNEAFSGPPALAARPDGTVQVAAQYTDGDIWTSTQTAVGAGTWKPFTDIGGSMATPPASAQLSTGVTTQFAVDADGKLWVYAQTGAVPFWRDLGGSDYTGTPVLATVRDGIQLFLRTGAGTITTATYRADGSLSEWTDLGSDGSGSPAVVVYPGYRLRVLDRSANGTIVTKQQNLDGTFPLQWDPLGTFVSAGSASALLDPLSGLTIVIARGDDGIINLAKETGQGTGVFTNWEHAQEEGSPLAATDPTLTVVNNGSSQTMILVYRTVDGKMIIATAGSAATLAAKSAFTPMQLATVQ